MAKIKIGALEVTVYWIMFNKNWGLISVPVLNVTMPWEASEFVSVYLPQTTWSDVHYFNTGIFSEKQNLCMSKYTLVYISCFGAWLILKNLLLMDTGPNWLSLCGNLKTQKETLGGIKINSVILFYLEVSVMCLRFWLPGWGLPPHHWDTIWFV